MDRAQSIAHWTILIAVVKQRFAAWMISDPLRSKSNLNCIIFFNQKVGYPFLTTFAKFGSLNRTRALDIDL